MKNFKNIIGATAILTTIAMYGMTPENTGDKKEQIHSVDLDYLLWQKSEPDSSSSAQAFYGPQALERAKATAHDINARLYTAMKTQEKRDIFSDFRKAVASLDLYDVQLIEKCARFSKMRLEHGISDGAEPFYGNACQFPIYDALGKHNLYSGFGGYEHQILQDRVIKNKDKVKSTR